MDYELISNFLKIKEGLYVTRIIVFQLCHTHMPAPTEFINYYILSMYSAGNLHHFKLSTGTTIIID